MDNQNLSPSQTHNLLLTTYLPNNQITRLAFYKLQHHRNLYLNSIQHRYSCTLACCSRNTLYLYAIFTSLLYGAQLGEWHFAQDITNILTWDTTLIIETAHKIVGVHYQEGHLSNRFLLSLQFLPLNPLDTSLTLVDKHGHYFLTVIKSNLILCISDLAIKKHRTRPTSKHNAEVLSQDVKWNQQNRNYIAEVMRIRLNDFDKVEEFRLCQEQIFFTGYKNKDISIYCISINLFFNQNETQSYIKKVGVTTAKRSIPLNKEGDCLLIEQRSILLQTQREAIIVDTFQQDFDIFMGKNNAFPLMVRQKKSLFLGIYQRQKGVHIITKRIIEMPCFIEQVLLKDQLIMYSNKTQLGCIYFETKLEEGIGLEGSLKNNMEITAFIPCSQAVIVSQIVLHSSFGSIIDFHLGRNLLLVQNHSLRQTRIWQLSRTLKVDLKPYVTHSKKMFLEHIPDLTGIETLLSNEYFLIRKDTSCLLIRESPQNLFETVIDNGVIDCRQTTIEHLPYLVLFYPDRVVLTNLSQATITTMFPPIKPSYLIDEFLVFKAGNAFHFINLRQSSIKKVSIEGHPSEILINTFIIRRTQTIRKKEKEFLLFQIIEVYSNTIRIYEVNVGTLEWKTVFLCRDVAEGPPLLNSILNEGLVSSNADIVANLQNMGNTHPTLQFRDRFRSITSPSYVFSNIHIQSTTSIKHANYYQYDHDYLVLITDEDNLLLYKSYLCFQCSSQRIFTRTPLPLHIIKGLKIPAQEVFSEMGLNMKRVCNYLFINGNWLEHNYSSRSFFMLGGQYWTLMEGNKIRLLEYRNQVTANCVARRIQTSIREEVMGVDSSNEWYCIYSRSAFQILNKEYALQWKPSLESQLTKHNESIIAIKLFQHYVAMSYYDYLDGDELYSQAVKFKFRVYNILTKTKMAEREKAMQEPILQIRYIPPDKLLLATSSAIFINSLKPDKTLELTRTVNLPSKRSFLSSMAYYSQNASKSKTDYLLLGSNYGGIAFWVGKWLEENKINEQWHEPIKCSIRQVDFMHYGEELKAVIADQDCNLIIMNIRKNKADKLADINIGSQVNGMRVRNEGDRTFCYVGLNDGSIKVLTAIKLERIEINFIDWQETFTQELPFLGGFNLRKSRELKQKYRTYKVTSRGNVVDGELLQNFFALTSTLTKHILQLTEMDIAQIKANIN